MNMNSILIPVGTTIILVESVVS